MKKLMKIATTYGGINIEVNIQEDRLDITFPRYSEIKTRSLVCALLADEDVRNLICKYQDEERKPFKLWKERNEERTFWYLQEKGEEERVIWREFNGNLGFPGSLSINIGDFVELAVYCKLTENMGVKELREMAGGVEYITEEDFDGFKLKPTKIL